MKRSIQLTKWIYMAMTIIGLMLFVEACVNQGHGFALPEGNVEAGKQAFAELGCNICHEVNGIERIGMEEDVHIILGGQTTQVKTYGELLTSIINPSHKVSREHALAGGGETGNSRMVIFNEIMTVQQLVDIVTFLEKEYEVTPNFRDGYPNYY